MKRVIFLLIFGAIILHAKAQITLEHTYITGANPSLGLINLSISGYKYAYYDSGSKQVKIYNLDHTLWKSISLVVPGGASVGNIYIAEELFDTDANVEVAFGVTFNNTNTVIIRSELGSNLFSFTNRQSMKIIDSGANGWKMILISYVNGSWNEEVYSLPGTGMPMRINSNSNEVPSGLSLKVFPNPASSTLQLNYQLLEQHKNIECSIINNLGQEIILVPLEANLNVASIDISNLASGNYIVVLKSNGQLLINSSFVK